ncbi:hypothetical protein, partial [Pseudochryseolinea flava]|uniref:hypothetical protein n=1 Tax=Pseudochryseolinea flava TaxID=2059302 RepID=UPI001C874EE0
MYASRNSSIKSRYLLNDFTSSVFPTSLPFAEFHFSGIHWYLAGFLEQVKIRVFNFNHLKKRYEKNKIHRSTDHWDLKRAG